MGNGTQGLAYLLCHGARVWRGFGRRSVLVPRRAGRYRYGAGRYGLSAPPANPKRLAQTSIAGVGGMCEGYGTERDGDAMALAQVPSRSRYTLVTEPLHEQGYRPSRSRAFFRMWAERASRHEPEEPSDA